MIYFKELSAYGSAMPRMLLCEEISYYLYMPGEISRNRTIFSVVVPNCRELFSILTSEPLLLFCFCGVFLLVTCKVCIRMVKIFIVTCGYV